MSAGIISVAGEIFVILIGIFTLGALVGRISMARGVAKTPLIIYRCPPFEKVIKPWGREIWIALNEDYCYKRIYINAGTRTSYQYHEKKRETNYVIKGKAEVWLENDHGVVEKFVTKEGDFFHIRPPRKHRVIAITDLILQEVSTPEVDDVIRLEDDYRRPNGRIESEHI